MTSIGRGSNPKLPQTGTPQTIPGKDGGVSPDKGVRKSQTDSIPMLGGRRGQLERRVSSGYETRGAKSMSAKGGKVDQSPALDEDAKKRIDEEKGKTGGKPKVDVPVPAKGTVPADPRMAGKGVKQEDSRGVIQDKTATGAKLLETLLTGLRQVKGQGGMPATALEIGALLFLLVLLGEHKKGAPAAGEGIGVQDQDGKMKNFLDSYQPAPGDPPKTDDGKGGTRVTLPPRGPDGKEPVLPYGMRVLAYKEKPKADGDASPPTLWLKLEPFSPGSLKETPGKTGEKTDWFESSGKGLKIQFRVMPTGPGEVKEGEKPKAEGPKTEEPKAEKKEPEKKAPVDPQQPKTATGVVLTKEDLSTEPTPKKGDES